MPKTEEESKRDLNIHKHIIRIDDKEVSEEMIYSIIGNRFHDCLKKNASN